MDEMPPNELEKAVAEETRLAFLKDFWSFLLHNKKWWMLPILTILLLLSLLMLLSTSAAAPFVYSFF
jgi:hypothetical protein